MQQLQTSAGNITDVRLRKEPDINYDEVSEKGEKMIDWELIGNVIIALGIYKVLDAIGELIYAIIKEKRCH